jgi:type I restriction enzyme R subunit
MDFKKATELFKDPDFDGEPVIIYEPNDDDDPVPPDPDDSDDDFEEDEDESEGITKVFISGVSARIIAERIEYIGEDGQLITESYKDFTRKKIHSEFESLDVFLQQWNDAKKKQAIIDELEEHGIVFENLAEEIGKDYGIFDLICHIAYDKPPLTRKERAENVKKRNYFTKYGEKAQAVLNTLLDKYADTDIKTIEDKKVLRNKEFIDLGTPIEIINETFGSKAKYEQAVLDLEEQLFNQEQTA